MPVSIRARRPRALPQPSSIPLFQLPELMVRLDHGDTCTPCDSRNQRESDSSESIPEQRLRNYIRRERPDSLREQTLPSTPPTTSEQTTEDAFVSHATDLIDRLAEWSGELDRREYELAEREFQVRSQLRLLRRSHVNR